MCCTALRCRRRREVGGGPLSVIDQHEFWDLSLFEPNAVYFRREVGGGFLAKAQSIAKVSQRRFCGTRIKRKIFFCFGDLVIEVSVPDSQVETLEEGTPKDSPVFSLVDLRNLRSRRSIGVW